MALARDALWENGHDESVEVNQRALIDKVLARYSGEFTVFRELLQNSDDAGSQAVEIRFETKGYLERQKLEEGGHTGTVINGIDGAAAVVSSNGRPKQVLPDLKTTLVHQWSFKNNGMVFRDEDWNRLKKIAEGNPDEEKIGAFGVGFYSLFSVTENPFVTSGGQWMGFHWKGDQLVARRGTVPSTTQDPSPFTEDPWTTFAMTLREPTPIPPAFDFTRFLSSSITFMAHLRTISVFFDDKRLAHLTKAPGVPKELGLPKGLRSRSDGGIMNVKGVRVSPLHIRAEVMRWVYSVGTTKPPPLPPKPVKAPLTSTAASGGFFSSLFSSLTANRAASTTSAPPPPPVEVVKVPEINLEEISESNVVLAIWSAEVDVKIDKKMAGELYRSTKKNVPPRVRVDLIYTGKAEYDESVKEDEKYPYATGSVFQGLRADLEGTGSAHVFIGHATAQTTGIGGHMATRFIPTVERESIDLVDRTVAIWNKELLYVGGFLARAAYNIELENVREAWNGAIDKTKPASRPEPEVQTWLRNRALHALRFFTFHASTPSSTVSQLLQEAFFACGQNQPFPIISSAGVRNASDVRLPDPMFAAFLKDLPVLPDEVTTGAKLMVDVLHARKLLKDITFVDVLQELRSRPLAEDEAVACLKWWIALQTSGELANPIPVRTEFLNAAVLSTGTPGGADEKIIPLSSIQTFMNLRQMGSIIPVDGPLPSHLLPLSVSRHLDHDSVSSVFPWRDLTVMDWLRHITTPTLMALDPEHDLTRSSPWAERVLTALGRAWPSLGKPHQTEIVELLKSVPCVPTTLGMKCPEQAYFSNVDIFHDLPIIQLSVIQVKGNLEKVLQTLGVRKHVELQLVFDRMIKTGDWTIADLTKYLVTVQSTLSTVELNRLSQTAAFPREDDSPMTTERKKPIRYRASELYEPLDVFRQMKLPILDWGTQPKWRNSSDEAKFLYKLGLRRFPLIETLVDLAAGEDAVVRPLALKYILDNYASRYSDFDPGAFGNRAFIPTKDGGLGRISEVYANVEWEKLKFKVVDQNLRGDALTKLKIAEHPSTTSLISFLGKTPPKTEQEAREWFGVLAGRISAFSPLELQKMSQLPIVPVKAPGPGSSPDRLLPPSQCYFAGTSEAQFHSKLFVFIDFGSRANGFLSACGTKHEPTVDEIAQIILANPRKFYDLAEGRENFLLELRNLAVNRRNLPSSTITRMKRSPMLLASRRVKKAKVAKKADENVADWDEEDWDYEYDLRRSDQIVVADDTNSYQQFGDSIFSAPQEDLLEGFYVELGCPRLSSLAREDYKTTSEVVGSRIASETRSLILQRLPLFLHEHTHEKPQVSYGWLNTGNNFRVKTFGKLTVTKSIKYEGKQLSQVREASAVARKDEYGGPIQLWLAGNAQVDMYEVATSLCRLLFKTPRVNDALLFMTILSTDLKALKRRGYNVDRILRQQQAEREAVIAKEKASSTTLVSDNILAPSGAVPGTFPAIPNNPSEKTLLEAPAPPSETTQEIVKRDQLPSATIQANTWQNLKERFGRPESILSGFRGSTPKPSTGLPPGSSPTITPLSNISSNIETAIKACKEEKSDLLRNRQQMQMVKESLNEGYCDVSGHVRNLEKAGSMANIPVFIAPDALQTFGAANTPDSQKKQDFFAIKRDALARFIHVVQPLCEIYKLPPKSMHVFYDLGGELIAFNRDGSIYLNLRFYEAWHDAQVKAGDLSTAYISWFFTLAHEIAHNLVQPHNSEHEFYFSAICEQYLIPLSRLLAPSS
ncbi:hypothetical protein JAAARDRAFT_409896 [Jaapia argillacea MUCL 33604]|uniref:Sacsin n=1 Tax=Jaapia argillacea MUCL 33604 TaxID=933084 RepID=A0A067PUP4_9AGAM|nr:hypothetical protein JAAARDRAFT_409896 [Jaapia argillacea MUCL 33604]